MKILMFLFTILILLPTHQVKAGNDVDYFNCCNECEQEQDFYTTQCKEIGPLITAEKEVKQKYVDLCVYLASGNKKNCLNICYEKYN